MAGWGNDDEVVGGGWGGDDELIPETSPARQELPGSITPSTAGAGRGGIGGPTAEQLSPAPRRGGTRAEARPFVGGDERLPLAPPKPAEPASILERPYTEPLPDKLSDAEVADLRRQQVAPWKREQTAREGAYVTGKGAGVLAASGDPSLADWIDRTTTPKPLDNTLGGAILQRAGNAAAILNDTQLSLTSGSFQLLQAGANAMRLVSGDSSEELQFLAAWADKAGDLTRKARSSELKQQASELSAIISDERANPATVLGYLMTHPKLLAMQAAESVPSMAAAAGGGRLLGGLVEKLSLRALSGAPASAAVTERIAELSATGARIGAVGGEATLGAAGVYDDVLKQGGSVAQAATAAGLAAIGYGVIGRLSGGGAEGALAAGQRRGVGKAIFAESAEEGGQSLSESGATAFAMGRDLDIATALNQAAAEAAVGGVVGGGVDIAMGARPAATPGQQLADAFTADTNERFFQRSDIDGFARAALSPNSVLADPNAVRPQDTRIPVAPKPILVEEQSTELPSPEEVAQQVAAGQAARAAQALQQQPLAADNQASRAAQDQTGLEQNLETPSAVGIAGRPQGALAAAADNQLRTNAEEAANVQPTQPEAAPPAVAAPAPAVPARATGGGRAAGAAQQPAAGSATTPVAQLRDSQVAARQGLISTLQQSLERLKAAGLTQQSSKDVAELEGKIAEQQTYLDTWQNLQEAEDGPELQSFKAVADEMQRVFGREIVPYVDRRGAGAADGFAFEGKAYVNLADPERSVAFTAFHELQHVIRGEAESGNRQSQLATQLLDQVWGMIPTDKKQQYARRYLFRAQMDPKAGGTMTMEQALADPILKDEMLSDFMGQRATDRAFWSELARKQPKTFGSFIRRWIDSLSKLVASLRGQDGEGRNKNIDAALAAVDRLERAKLVAEKVVREWAASNPQLAKQQGVQVEADPSTIEDDQGAQDDTKQAGARRTKPAAEAEPARKSARADEQGGQRDGGLGPQEVRTRVAYGSPRDGATSVVGVHYSREDRTTLVSAMYGRGLAGAEAERLRDADPRLSQRIYFYIDRGTGINPESGVGGRGHQVELRNLYDADADLMRLGGGSGGFSGFELRVLEAGFDGYFTRDAGPSGNAVLLGQHAVPVEQLGSTARTKAPPVPPAQQRPKTVAERIASSTSLPSGQMTGPRWRAMVKAVLPGEFAKVQDSPAFDIERTLYKDELAREIANASEELVFSRRDDELGAFSPFDDLTSPDDIKDDGTPLTEDEMAAISEELNGGLALEPPKPRAFEAPNDDVLSSVGIMAEQAYKPIEYVKDASGDSDAVVQFNAGGRSYSFSIELRDDGEGFNVEFPGISGVGAPLAFRKVSERFAAESNNRVASSIDLQRRGFDLFTAVPSAARKRVLETWQTIGKLPGAAEFKNPRFDASAPSVPKLQQIADSMFAGTYFAGEAMPAVGAGWYRLEMTTGGRPAGGADIQYISGADRKIVLHTTELNRGSSVGKAFYQAAFAFAHAIGVPVSADPEGLSGVNTYRRTEQMMSAAVRAGVAPDGIPGVGQRIYGWNQKAKDATQRGRNLVRLALAAARNAVELAPEARDLTYNITTGAFGWRAKTKHSLGAEAYVSRVLRDKDARVVSLSRSTLARAAITFQAIDGTLEIGADTRVKSPVLYSTREGYAELDDEQSPTYNGARKGGFTHIGHDGAEVSSSSRDQALADIEARQRSANELIRCLST